MESFDDLSPGLCAVLDVQRARIREEYGDEVAAAVGRIMQSIVISALLYSQHEGLRAVDIIGALSETITVINSMAEEYVERARKAGLN
jgi:hypothetical protein